MFNQKQLSKILIYNEQSTIHLKTLCKWFCFSSIQNSLLRILTAKERDRARDVFQSIDQDNDGIITAGEARKAQTSWFHKINKESQSCSVRWAEYISHWG